MSSNINSMAGVGGKKRISEGSDRIPKSHQTEKYGVTAYPGSSMISGSGSYNKSLHSDVDSLKSSLKNDSCDILSNSDKSSTNNEQQRPSFKVSIMASGPGSNRDYLDCRRMPKVMSQLGDGKAILLVISLYCRCYSNFRESPENQSV